MLIKKIFNALVICGLAFLSVSSAAEALTYQEILQSQPAGKVLGASTITFVNSAAHNAIGTTNTLSLSASSGNLIYIVASYQANGAGCGSNTITVSDSASNAYIQIGPNLSQTYNCSAQFYAKNVTGGNLNILVTFSLGVSSAASALQFSGLSAASPLDVSATGLATTGTTISSGSFSTASPNEVIVAGASNFYSPTWAAGSVGGNVMTIPPGVTESAGSGGGNTTAEYAVISSALSGAAATINQSGQMYGQILAAGFIQSGAGGSSSNPPVISNVQSSSITSSVATISWTTDENSDSQVQYGPTTGYGSASGLNSSLVTSHSVSLSGLSAATAYHYIVQSRDAAGNLGISADNTFTTASGAVSDTSPPSAPSGLSATAVSSSQINLAWTASTDNVSVTGYKIFRGGTQIATTGSNSYSDTGLAAGTAYSYTVAAFDAAGNVSSQSSSAAATTQSSSSGGVPTITWAKAVKNGANWPSANGYMTVNFDPVSDRMIIYGHRGFAGTVQVSNGSTAVTWVSGDKFGDFWQTGDQIILGSNTYIISGITTTPQAPPATNNKTQLSLSQPYSGCSSSPCSVSYSASEANVIYSNDIIEYDAGLNQWSWGPGTGALRDEFIADTPAMPGQRHPIDQQTIDTKRNLLWIMGGVNQSYQLGGAVSNGSAQSTISISNPANDPFMMNGNLNGIRIGLGPNSSSYTYYIIDHVVSSSTLVTTTQVPAGSYASAGLFAPEQSNSFLPNGKFDTYYLTLNSNPSLDVWTQVTGATHEPPGVIESAMQYDPEDDAIILLGYDEGADTNATYVFCSTMGNPSPGVLASSQTAVGCTRPDDWSQVSTTCIGSQCLRNHPPGDEYTSLSWDSATHRMLQYGGAQSYPPGTGTAFPSCSTVSAGSSCYQNTIFSYNPSSHVWTQSSAAVNPPVEKDEQTQPAIGNDAALHKLFYHSPDTNTSASDWMYDPVADSWTQINTVGTGPVEGSGGGSGTMATFDSLHNSILTWNAGGSPDVWVGQLSQGSGLGGPTDTTPPTIPANVSATAVSSSQINLSWTASTDNVAVAGYQIFRGGIQIATSGATNYSDTGLTAASNYTYTVSAFDAAGNASGQSVAANATTQNSGDTTAPSVPTGLSATAVSSSQINLSWTASTDNVAVAGYQIFRGGIQIATSSLNSYSSAGLSPATGYSYTVKAFDAAGNISSASVSAGATTLSTVSGSVITPLTIQEALYPGDLTGTSYGGNGGGQGGGITRTQDPVTVGIPLADSAGISSVSQLGLSGTALGQFRVLGCWEGSPTPSVMATSCGNSGHIKWVQIDTEANVTAGQTNTSLALTTGSGNFGGSNLATDNGSTISVNTGTAQFTIKKANFNVIDQAIINGKTIVAPGTSQGMVVTGPNPAAAYPANVTCGTGAGKSPCTTTYSSANDPNSTCSIEENGPVKSTILCTGSHVDASGNAYMQFTVREYFYAGKTGVKVMSELRNAQYGTSNTFATAYKGMQSYELRLAANLSGTVNFAIGNHTAAPTIGTLAGTDSVDIYQGASKLMEDTRDGVSSAPYYVAPTADQGYAIAKNGTTLISGTSSQYPQGWADESDSSGAGVDIGIEQFASFDGDRSLEFNNGGDDVRIGIFARENSQPVYQTWPQWHIQNLFLDFHDTALASPASEFLKFQQFLVARAPLTQYNSSGALFYPLTDPAVEDNYYRSVLASANALPSNTQGAGGYTIPASQACCIKDIGTLDTLNWPLQVHPYYDTADGGPFNQLEDRMSYLDNFITRGFTGRYLYADYFYKHQAESYWPHSDGFSWRNEPHVTAPGAQLDGEGNPSATSANSALSYRNWATTDPEHDHWYGMPQYYFMTGDETIRDAMLDGTKDYYLNSDTYQDGKFGGLWNARSVGIEMMGAARFSQFLNDTGDPDSNAVLQQAIDDYNVQIAPTLCVTGTPAGCAEDTPNQYTASQSGVSNPWPHDGQGISPTRGVHFTDHDAGVEIDFPGETYCGVTPYDYRAEATFQASQVIQGLWEMHNVAGPSSPYFTSTLNYATAQINWALKEMFSYNGTANNWNTASNGFRYYEMLDIANGCNTVPPDGKNYFGPQSQGTVWMPFLIDYYITGQTSWKPMFDIQMEKDMASNGIGYSGIVDFGAYQMAAVIGSLSNPTPLPALNTVPITRATDNGSGSYTVSWVVPAGAQNYWIKWGNLPIVDWIGFNPSTNTWIGDPSATMNWFAAKDVSNPPAPSAAGTTQSFTINTNTPGLTAADFSVKAYVVANPNAPIISSFTATPSSINSGSSAALQWNVSNATSITIDSGVGSQSSLSAGSVGVSPAVTTTYTLTAANSSGSITAQTTITVAAPQAPIISSLTASGLTATSTTISWQTDVVADTQVNYGLNPAYGSSSALANTSQLVTNHSVSLISLVPGTTYHFQALSRGANSLLAQTGDFTFTTLALPPPPAPIISSFSATPAGINQGNSSVLSWNTQNSSSLSINQGIGAVSPISSGTKSVAPTQTTVYTLTAGNGSATSTAQTTITVTPLGSGGGSPSSTPALVSPSILNFTANPAAIIAGQSSTLSFTASGTSPLVLSLDQGLGQITQGLNQTVSPATTTTYTLTATNSQGSATAQVTVTVSAAPTVGGGNLSSPPSGGGGGGGGGGSPTITTPVVNPDGTITFIPKTAPQTPPGIPQTPSQTNTGSLIKLLNIQGTFYLEANGVLHGITNPGMLATYGFTFSQAEIPTAADLNLPKGSLLTPGDGSLVKSQQDPTVYLISDQQRYAFTSAQVFTSLGFKFSNVLLVTNPELQQLPKASILNNSASAHLPGTDINIKGTIYWMGQDNQLHAYPSLAVYNSWHIPGNFKTVVPANAADLLLPIGAEDTQRTVN